MGVLQGEQARQAMARLRHRGIGEQRSAAAEAGRLGEGGEDLAADEFDVSEVRQVQDL